MKGTEPIPHLFRTEYRKIISVLSRLFGIEHIEVVEDIVSDTFLQAAELWGLNGLPSNPTAWLYAVAKNKTKDYLKRDAVFAQKVVSFIRQSTPLTEEIEIDLSGKNINDSQLAMMFAICHPSISAESQVALSLNLLCGFGADEIAEAFLTSREVIYKRLKRAKEKLRAENVKIEHPSLADIQTRLPTVLTTLYLLFNEGYYSALQKTAISRELCLEAMRLNFFLLENSSTNQPPVNALLSLMCFHSSRFDARTDENGEMVLYHDQDASKWNQELISRGEYYLNESSRGNELSKYHLEAAIAYWHTHQNDTAEKWENILQLYNKLLQVEYSPMAALNRTYALAKANGKQEAIAEAEKLQLKENHLYHSLLGNLYTAVDNARALRHFNAALKLAKTKSDRLSIQKQIDALAF